MWRVQITDEASQIFESGLLSDDDRLVIQTWAQTITEFGPEGLLRRSSVWGDHELDGEWRGHRSSRFSYRGRIIYRVNERQQTVIVVRITTNHNYRRNKE